jgi:hypothetical protein
VCSKTHELHRADGFIVILNWALHFLNQDEPKKKLCRLFQKYSRIYFQFLDAAEQRAVALASTAAAVNAWRVSFALQRALKERQVFRVECVLRRDGREYASWISLDDIVERVDGGWSEAEEVSLEHESDHYAALSKSIKDLQSKFDSETLLRHRDELMRDSEYKVARETLAMGAGEMSDLWLKSTSNRGRS